MNKKRDIHSRAVTQRGRYVNGGEISDDTVVVEEPLEIRVGGETLAITMRTPGNDEALTVGFLFGEGYIQTARDVKEVGYAVPNVDSAGCNTMDVVLAQGIAGLDDAKQPVRRGTIMTAACGVCGRKSIQDLLDMCSPQALGPTLPASVLADATARLSSLQPIFADTGGSHAAAVLNVSGEVLASHEDIGRHNAVDKVIGELLFDGAVKRANRVADGDEPAPFEPLDSAAPAVLVVSGRVSFEIVQKAAVAGIPVVASVSAASSLAIDLACDMGIALAAFVRDGRYNIYTNSDRITNE